MTCHTVMPPREFSSEPGPEIVKTSCLIETTEQASAVNLTGNQECDVRTALKRGLAEYLASLPEFIHPSFNTRVRLKEVWDVWPDQEDKRKYPSAIVYSDREHLYDASSFTPVVDPACKVDAMTYLVKHAEVTFDMMIDILSTNPEERICFGMQMEDALNPVDWMYGFQLELPHYFNARGTYRVVTGNYPDDEPRAFQRNRHLVFMVTGQLSQYRKKRITPLTETRIDLTVEDGNEPC